MLLTQDEKETILSGFPNIKLSYENVIYKKVSTSDYLIAIPKGTKCFAWLTMYQNKPTCFIMELARNKQIVDIKIFNACFSSELAYGSIFYGTLFYTSGNRFFAIEDIFAYKGADVERKSWQDKLVLLSQICKKDMKQMSYNNSFIVFGLPIMAKSCEELDKLLSSLEYPIIGVQFYLLNRVNNFLCMDYKSYNKPLEIKEKSELQVKPILEVEKRTKPNKEQIFIVKPDIQYDIYYLYTQEANGKEEKCGTAHVADYETSVMMNKLFRIIKENDNLDALEESDDEEEFENENADKFVKLYKSEKMICQYNYKFKRWVPLKVASENAVPISVNGLNNLIKIYEQNKRRY